MGYFISSLSKTATSTCLSASEYALLLFALIVVIGLIGEHKRAWPHPKYELYVILVAVGCGGELVADGGIFLFSRHLQAIADAELQGAVTKAGDARTSAGKAADAAGSAQENADKAVKDARDAAHSAATVHQEAIDLQVAIETERKKRLQFQSAIAPRELTEVRHGSTESGFFRG